MKRGKVAPSEGIEIPDGERIKEVEKNGYKHLGILENNKIKESEMKENFLREYLRRKKLIMKSTLSGRNKIMAINTWAVSLMRYGAGIVKWTKNLDEIGRKTRKVMTLNKELGYPLSPTPTGLAKNFEIANVRDSGKFKILAFYKALGKPNTIFTSVLTLISLKGSRREKIY